jgi:hypothetical protein
MIVRIFTEGQFRLDDSERSRIEQLDEALRSAVDGGDQVRFKGQLAQLIDYVREHGTPLADDELTASDLMIPPPDTSLEEAKADFTGEGLIPEP